MNSLCFEDFVVGEGKNKTIFLSVVQYMINIPEFAQVINEVKNGAHIVLPMKQKPTANSRKINQSFWMKSNGCKVCSPSDGKTEEKAKIIALTATVLAYNATEIPKN